VPLKIVEEAEEINQAGGILLFNFGLHDDKGDFLDLENCMRPFLANLKANSTFSLVVFRETTAQHFDTPSGMYLLVDRRSSSCTALEWTEDVGRRDQAVRNAAMAVGYDPVSPTESSYFGDRNKMVVLPFHNYTAELHGGHPIDHGHYNNITQGECTHFCSTPLLWVPLWRTLRITMDTALSSIQPSSSVDETITSSTTSWLRFRPQSASFDTSTEVANAILPEAEGESRDSTPTTNITRDIDTTTTTTIHHDGIAVLPLLPWEEQAIEELTKKGGNMSCVPPQGVHDT
jgi:hypothetical protein